jgi:hypothetical protein
LKQGGPRQGSENEETGQLYSIPFTESKGPFENAFIIMVQSKDESGEDHDIVVVNGLHGFFQLMDLIKGFIHVLQVFGRKGFHTNEERDASALRSQFQKLRVPGQGHARLAGPLLFEGFQSGEELFGITAIPRDIVVDENKEITL